MTDPTTTDPTTTACPHCGEPVAGDDEFCESCGTDLTGDAAAGGGGPPEARARPGAEPEPVNAGAGIAGAGSGPAGTASGPPASATGEEVPAGGESARTHLIAPPGAPSAPDGPPVATAAPRCPSCQGEVGPDGWCTVCGARAGNGRDHVTEQPSPTVAAVSDRGIVHRRNEDACALAADGDWAALVVCDGVTSSTDSDVAALAAVQAARRVLTGESRPTSPSVGQRIEHWTDRLQRSAVAADEAADATVASTGASDNPPSCTFVAAVVDDDLLVAGGVGDSRAYWLPDGGPAQQLSADDSWAAEQVAQGMPREAAEADRRAHAITRWLGADSPDVSVTCSATTVSSPGWLLVCSDGLWNYCSEAADLADLVAARAGSVTGDDPLALAEALVAWANEQGGHDNITAALARVVPAAPVSTALAPEGAP